MARGTAADTSVRPAAAGDVPAVAAVQARAWHAGYADLLGPETLAAVTPEALAAPWREAVTRPPSPRHLVLVALSRDLVVGFAAVGPSGDPDAADVDGELVALWVDPAHQRQGHGSRLLAAAADHLRASGLTGVATWTPEGDRARRTFLASAGLVPDGGRRTLATGDGAELTELRYTAALGEAPAPPTHAGTVEPGLVEPVEIEIHEAGDGDRR
jgi:GNAT superfamily N-acetyltransferase